MARLIRRPGRLPYESQTAVRCAYLEGAVPGWDKPFEYAAAYIRVHAARVFGSNVIERVVTQV